MLEKNPLSTDLTLHWVSVYLFACLLVIYQLVCHLFSPEIQLNINEDQRIIIRSVLYAISIMIFPLSSLLRHILLRLNQTMPSKRSAKSRYLITIFITLAVVEIIGLFGITMFILGDNYNTLYIFSSLAALGLFLHKPKTEEYSKIIEALNTQK